MKQKEKSNQTKQKINIQNKNKKPNKGFLETTKSGKSAFDEILGTSFTKVQNSA